MTDPQTISTLDGSMYVAKIGVDRRLNSDNQTQASATVMKRMGEQFARTTMTADDFSNLAENGTPDEKNFANKSIEAIHKFEGSPMMASRETQSFPRPTALDTPSTQNNLAMASPSPTPR